MSQEAVSRRGLLGTSIKSAAELVGPNLPLLKQLSGKRLPVVYCTDGTDELADALELACLYAQPDIELRGVILDTAVGSAGFRTVHQLNYLTGRSVLALGGLQTKLRNETDRALDQPAETQQGVSFLLSELESNKEKVAVVVAGAGRDLAVAQLRNPRLLQTRCRAVYAHLSEASDPHAHTSLLRAGLPLYRLAEARLRLGEVLGGASEPLVKLCHGLWRKETGDPLAYLQTPLAPDEKAALLHTERSLRGGGLLPHGPAAAELLARLPLLRTA
ncbi:hypothetical protein [Armatimonas rosea]|uniref:Uncharacterized protein n=1 Tax=Armatimonas rosea TaxID=685828 RepID=A0A7W9SM61_ARMRO|nr:hypothetical protein [Armatimonas rosea]MBB6048458.1 hypothetical protein [Armatimonas rosea]